MSRWSNLTQSVDIGKYRVQWHEGTLTITECTGWESENIYVYDTILQEDSVNHEWEVEEVIKKSKNDEYDLRLYLTGAEKTDLITFCTLCSLYQDRYMPFDWEDVLITHKPKRLLVNGIPKGLFRFVMVQEDIGDYGTCRRYELKENDYAMSKLLTLALNIIKNDLEYDGYSPKEIHIELRGKGTPVAESYLNSINFVLNKETLGWSYVYDLIEIIDGLDLEITWFILWTDTKKTSDKKRKRTISGRTRQNVLMRDNYTCQICGATVKDGAKLEIDHIIPYSKGGTNKEDNLQVLCQQCNREKHNRDDLLHDKRKLAELEGK